MNGTVKNIGKTRSYGFISAANRGEYFFHQHDFVGHWDDLLFDVETRGRNKVPVEFEVVKSDKGPRAANVRRTDFPNQAV